MRTSSIYLKFASEATYERLTFTSNVVTYLDIKKHLEKKKYVGKLHDHHQTFLVFPEKKTEKSDNIVLFDVMKNQEIGEEDIIAANMHVLVIRTPQKQEPIELTYNPKLTGENTLG